MCTLFIHFKTCNSSAGSQIIAVNKNHIMFITFYVDGGLLKVRNSILAGFKNLNILNVDGGVFSSKA